MNWITEDLHDLSKLRKRDCSKDENWSHHSKMSLDLLVPKQQHPSSLYWSCPSLPGAARSEDSLPTPFAVSACLCHTHSSHRGAAGVAHMDWVIVVRQWQQHLLFTTTCYSCRPCWEWFSVLLKIFTGVEYSALCLVFLYVTITASFQNADRAGVSNSWFILNPNRTEQLQIAGGKYFEEKAKPVVHHFTVAAAEVFQNSADSLTSAMHTAKPGCMCCFKNKVGLLCYCALNWYGESVQCFSICRAVSAVCFSSSLLPVQDMQIHSLIADFQRTSVSKWDSGHDLSVS